MHDIVYGNLTWGITICFVLNMFIPFIDGIASFFFFFFEKKMALHLISIIYPTIQTKPCDFMREKKKKV